MKDYNALSLEMHEVNKGKIEVCSKVAINNKDDLSIAYTPGVAEPCRKIHENKNDVYKYTSKGNMVAVVTDGTAVLGLGDIGPEAGLPVMEGKCILFKEYGEVDAFPICIDSKDVEEIIKTVKLISPGFGGINLEDISSPRCYEIENRLKAELDIPVFHDDQHGTAVVTTAALINALRVVNKEMSDIKVVISGAGAAGIAIMDMIYSVGVRDILLVDRSGILNSETVKDNKYKKAALNKSNKDNISGSLADALKNADVFIGVSAGGIVSGDMIKAMNKDAIVLAMANPIPEIYPDEAISAGATVVGTGRSDFNNQINNVLVFPGIFKGALSVRASEINEEMKKAAAYAIANMVSKEDLNKDYIVPSALDKDSANKVAEAVAKAAIETNVSRI